MKRKRRKPMGVVFMPVLSWVYFLDTKDQDIVFAAIRAQKIDTRREFDSLADVIRLIKWQDTPQGTLWWSTLLAKVQAKTKGRRPALPPAKEPEWLSIGGANEVSTQTKTKTVTEWLDTLEEPVRTQALTNFVEFKREDKLKDNLYEAISAAFPWSLSDEGFRYWCDIANDVSMSLKYKPLTRANLPKKNALIMIRSGKLRALYYFKHYTNNYFSLKALTKKGEDKKLPTVPMITMSLYQMSEEDVQKTIVSDGTELEFSLIK
jgi:hypothetical protein